MWIIFLYNCMKMLFVMIFMLRLRFKISVVLIYQYLHSWYSLIHINTWCQLAPHRAILYIHYIIYIPIYQTNIVPFPSTKLIAQYEAVFKMQLGTLLCTLIHIDALNYNPHLTLQVCVSDLIHRREFDLEFVLLDIGHWGAMVIVLDDIWRNLVEATLCRQLGESPSSSCGKGCQLEFACLFVRELPLS